MALGWTLLAMPWAWFGTDRPRAKPRPNHSLVTPTHPAPVRASTSSQPLPVRPLVVCGFTSRGHTPEAFPAGAMKSGSVEAARTPLGSLVVDLVLAQAK